jgi:hypothetical protein
MKITIATILCLSLLLSCKQKGKPDDDTTKEINVLPYTVMLGSEITEVENTPIAITKYTLNNKGAVIDSSYIERAEFKKLAQAFLDNNVADSLTKNNYTEQSFEDLSTGMYNFSYETKKESLPIKNLILSFSKETESTLKYVRINRKITQNNIVTNQILYWKNKYYFTITTTKDSSNINLSETIKVVWNTSTEE